ncbi:hypothetical protein HDV00_000715 [Rhizophlyctis rosea]|nr:hypothetical protein HDV00_000715 [Rhizophlyctis rosea]
MKEGYQDSVPVGMTSPDAVVVVDDGDEVDDDDDDEDDDDEVCDDFRGIRFHILWTAKQTNSLASWESFPVTGMARDA